MTPIVPATYGQKLGPAVQCCCTLHQSVYSEVSLVLRINMLCSWASGDCRIPFCPETVYVGWSFRHPTCPSYLNPWRDGHMAPVPEVPHHHFPDFFFLYPPFHVVSKRRKDFKLRLPGSVFPEDRHWGEGGSCWASCNPQEMMPIPSSLGFHVTVFYLASALKPLHV